MLAAHASLATDLVAEQWVANLLDHLVVRFVLGGQELPQECHAVAVREVLVLLDEVAQLLALEAVEEALWDVDPMRLLLLLPVLVDGLLEPHEVFEDDARVPVHLVHLAVVAVHQDVGHARDDAERDVAVGLHCVCALEGLNQAAHLSANACVLNVRGDFLDRLGAVLVFAGQDLLENLRSATEVLSHRVSLEGA